MHGLASSTGNLKTLVAKPFRVGGDGYCSRRDAGKKVFPRLVSHPRGTVCNMNFSSGDGGSCRIGDGTLDLGASRPARLLSKGRARQRDQSCTHYGYPFSPAQANGPRVPTLSKTDLWIEAFAGNAWIRAGNAHFVDMKLASLRMAHGDNQRSGVGRLQPAHLPTWFGSLWHSCGK